MANKSRYLAVTTKLRSISSAFLSEADYQKMLDLPDVDALVKFLKQHSVYQLDSDFATSAAESEKLLKKVVFQRQARILPFLLNDDLKFVQMLLRRSEIEYLKQIIRAIHTGKELNIFDFESQSYFEVKDFSDLLTSNSLEALLKKLQSTSYASILAPYIKAQKKHMLFYLETELDRFYFKELLTLVGKLNSEDRAILTGIIGVNIDLLNLQWIYRAKKYYDLSTEPLFNFALAGGDKLNLKKLKELAYANSEKEFLKLMPFVYREDFAGDDLLIESNMERRLYHLFQQKNKKGSVNLSTVIAFLHTSEYEMRDIFTILESKRYGIAAADVKNFLVRYKVS